MVIAFGEHELDPGRLELRRRGQLVPVKPKALELLAYLARHRHRVVGRHELERSLWKGTMPGGNALDGLLLEVREAVGDDARGQRVIAARDGGGLRFVALLGVPGARRRADRVLFGREPLVARLQAAVRETLDGHGRIILVRGTSGSGKSALLRVAAGAALDYGMRVSHLEVPPVNGRARAGAWRRVLEELLPFRDEAWKSEKADPEAVLKVCLAAARKRPLALLLDDLVSPDDLAVLEHLAPKLESIPLLVIAAVRHAEHAPPSLGPIPPELARAPRTEEVRLEALGRAAVEALSRTHLVFDPSSRLLDEIHELSGGNPGRVIRLCERLNERSKHKDPGGIFPREASLVSADLDRLLDETDVSDPS